MHLRLLCCALKLRPLCTHCSSKNSPLRLVMPFTMVVSLQHRQRPHCGDECALTTTSQGIKRHLGPTAAPWSTLTTLSCCGTTTHSSCGELCNQTTARAALSARATHTSAGGGQTRLPCIPAPTFKRGSITPTTFFLQDQVVRGCTASRGRPDARQQVPAVPSCPKLYTTSAQSGLCCGGHARHVQLQRRAHRTDPGQQCQ